MADYYPLLARALDALPDRSPALRKAVYDRARNALVTQLRSLEPPLSDADIDLERRALDAAIDRLELENGDVPAPANDAAPDPAPARPAPRSAQGTPAEIPEPSPPEPRAPEFPSPEPPPSPPARPEPPSLPPAGPPSFVPVLPEPERREAPISIAARRPAQAQPEPAAPDDAPPAPEEAPTAGEAAAEGGNGRQRPRIEVVPPRAGRSRALRNVFVGVVLVAVIGLIAVAAFLLRDRPQALQAAGPADSQQAEGEAKFGDRVGGEPAPAERPRPDGAAPTRAPAPSRGAAASGQANLAVSQRAALIEENTAAQGAQPTTASGRVTWRLDSVNGDQNQPLQTAVTATVTFPEAGLTLVMTIQRNIDETLPASHTIKLAFSQSGPDASARVVQDVGLLQAKDEESARGAPVSGLPVRVRDNLFLIGLSSLRNDVERNTDLLLHRNWFDLAVRYTSGKRAVIAFEKGAAGAQAMQSAFDAWQ